MKSFGVPTIMIGGGGYSLRNIARCWVYETSVAIWCEIPNDIPEHAYSMYYSPANKIHVPVSNVENKNTPAEIENITKQIIWNLKNVKATTPDLSY